MEFYDATSAKQYARNRTRIIKEINDIEENILQAVDENQFECDVFNTVMTDSREIAEPIRDAKAHCLMELSKVSIHKDYENEDDEVFVKEIICGNANIESPYDRVFCGNAKILEQIDSYANCGNAEGIAYRKNYFRVGEILTVKDRNDVNPLEFKVVEVNGNGDIINMEILNRGEFTDNIFDTAQLQYKDMTNWLNIDSDFGVISDLKITRENEILVKDLTDGLTDSVATAWFPIQKTYNIESLPSMGFGELNDVYIKNQNEIFIKTENGWFLSNKMYDYISFKLPFNFGLEGTVIYNLFGNNWVKTHCGWYKVHNIYDLGDSVRPDAFAYREYDIVYYNEVITDEEGEIVQRIPHRIYKCCHNVWKDIIFEYDWQDKPSDNFGEDFDLFIYPEGNYRVKINGHWEISKNEWRFDSIYLEDTFGDIHDVLTYTGKYEPFTTYVKMGVTKDHPNGHWELVEKVWNLNDYLLGRLPVNVDLVWRIKAIILDDLGDGYMYPTTVVFNIGNASAYVKIINDKIIDIILINNGDDYVEIPEVNFVMEAPVMSKKYYQVWKRLQENSVLQDEMQQVMDYFESTKKYAISRVTNDQTGNTFYWHLQWN